MSTEHGEQDRENLLFWVIGNNEESFIRWIVALHPVVLENGQMEYHTKAEINACIPNSRRNPDIILLDITGNHDYPQTLRGLRNKFPFSVNVIYIKSREELESVKSLVDETEPYQLVDNYFTRSLRRGDIERQIESSVWDYNKKQMRP